tara:strand:+ start:675 stop:842 length:168 start_codon:yes stop_codon:yes gene_type:complete
MSNCSVDELDTLLKSIVDLERCHAKKCGYSQIHVKICAQIERLKILGTTRELFKG